MATNSVAHLAIIARFSRAPARVDALAEASETADSSEESILRSRRDHRCSRRSAASCLRARAPLCHRIKPRLVCFCPLDLDRGDVITAPIHVLVGVKVVLYLILVFPAFAVESEFYHSNYKVGT